VIVGTQSLVVIGIAISSFGKVAVKWVRIRPAVSDLGKLVTTITSLETLPRTYGLRAIGGPEIELCSPFSMIKIAVCTSRICGDSGCGCKSRSVYPYLVTELITKQSQISTANYKRFRSSRNYSNCSSPHYQQSCRPSIAAHIPSSVFL
jgi:hypothetical protein